jgi:peroxiredoxin
MQQVVDLQNDPDFQALDVEIVSIALDSAAEQTQGQREYGITDVPMLVDADRRMSEAYDVNEVGSGNRKNRATRLFWWGRMARSNGFGTTARRKTAG